MDRRRVAPMTSNAVFPHEKTERGVLRFRVITSNHNFTYPLFT